MNKSTKTFLLVFLLILGVMGIFAMNNKLFAPDSLSSSEKQISESTLQLISNIQNDDVVWDGTFVGIAPIELTRATLALQDIEENINPLLISALIDEDKFVAAHVLLTLRTSATFTASSDTWNGLKIQLQPNGKASFDGNNLMELQKFWKKMLQL